jgi:propionyl-CoA carboxylase beta chain
MGPEAAVNIIHRKAISEAADPEEAKRRFAADYRERFASPYKAAELGFIDEVIEPRFVRKRLSTYLELLRTKRDENPPKKHGNIPL